MIKTNLQTLKEMTVLPEWIDHNGHMNVAYYVLVFDQSLDVLLEQIELTPEYRKASGNTVYVLETHVSYLQEVKEGDALLISFRVVDCDEKRIHLFLEMHHKELGFLAATSEQMILHIDTSGPKAHPMPKHIQDNLKALQKSHSLTPSPNQLGAAIGIRRKIAS
ncbi:MAG: thioesterase family protein [Pseudomonas marincola]